MKSARMTIGGLLATISLFGLAFASLRHPTAQAESAMLTATFAVLLLSLISAALYRGGRRAFWIGFALFGWSYGLVNLGVGFGTATSPQLATTRGIYRLQNWLHPPTVTMGGGNLPVELPVSRPFAEPGRDDGSRSPELHDLGFATGHHNLAESGLHLPQLRGGRVQQLVDPVRADRPIVGDHARRPLRRALGSFRLRESPPV